MKNKRCDGDTDSESVGPETYSSVTMTECDDEIRHTGGLLVTDHLKLCVMNPWNLMTRRCQETTLEFLILESQTGHLSVSQLSDVFFL